MSSTAEADDATVCSVELDPPSPTDRNGRKIITPPPHHAEEVLASIHRTPTNMEKAECDKQQLAEEDSVEEIWGFPDGGLKAWSVVLGCFIFSSCQMGYGLAWGVMVEDLHQHALPDVPLSTLNFIVGVNNFSLSGGSLIGGRLGDRYGYKKMIAISGMLCFISLVISAFSSHSLALLFVFQGFGLGLAMSLAMPLFMSLPSQWFLKNRGLASGIAVSGAGIGGGCASLIIRGLLPSLGYQNTLLVYASMNGCLCLGAWFLLDVRYPPRPKGEISGKPKRWFPLGVWRSPSIYLLMSSVAIGVFGYLSPYYYLTPYTILTVPNLRGSIPPALPVILVSFGSGLGRMGAGLLADRIGPLQTLFTTFFVSGLMEVVVWPLADTYGKIIAFACLYGFFAGWFMSLIPYSAAQLFGMENLATVVGVVVLSCSPGQLAGASISGVILTHAGSYKYVAFYAGACTLAGAVLALCTRFSRERRLIARY